jgi:hypothetical protein
MVNYNNEKNVEDDSTEKCFGTLIVRQTWCHLSWVV